ncbi:hypothetical protein Tco_1156994 [Tanacetum coccineum]
MPHDSPLPRVHTLGSDEGRLQPNELMKLVTKLSDRVVVLENDLTQKKKTYGAAFTKLIKKVKTLEKTVKSNKARRRAQFVVSDDEEEDSFKQGRKIAEIDEDPDISLVQQMIHHDAQTQGRQEYDLEPNFEFTAPKEVYTAEPDISTANVPVSTAGAEVSTATESLVYIRRSAAKRKDKEERQRIANAHKKASTFKPEEWDNMQAQIEADEELAHRVNTFTLMESDDTVPKVVAGSSKRSAEELGEESSKRQRIGEGSEPAEESKDKESDELSQEQLQQLIIIVPAEGMNVEALQTKYPIIDWERYMYDPLTWRLYDTCGVHHVSTETGLDIFMLVEKDYPMTRGLPMLMLVNKLQVDQHLEMADELLRKIFILSNRPRH